MHPVPERCRVNARTDCLDRIQAARAPPASLEGATFADVTVAPSAKRKTEAAQRTEGSTHAPGLAVNAARAVAFSRHSACRPLIAHDSAIIVSAKRRARAAIVSPQFTVPPVENTEGPPMNRFGWS